MAVNHNNDEPCPLPTPDDATSSAKAFYRNPGRTIDAWEDNMQTKSRVAWALAGAQILGACSDEQTAPITSGRETVSPFDSADIHGLHLERCAFYSQWALAEPVLVRWYRDLGKQGGA
jgi:hypothetical protein